MAASLSLKDYPAWALTTFGARFDNWEKMLFGSNAQAALNAANNHEFFREMRSILGSASREFEAATGARLLLPDPSASGLVLKMKSYEMAVEKSYRINVLRNKAFPAPPKGGWVQPPSWYGRLNDIVRGTLVCAYLDALPWLAERLRCEADKRGLTVVFNSEQREEGYYAFHVYATLQGLPLQIRNDAGDIAEKPYDVSVEIQLTTQLQDALREVTHFFYEERRVHGLIADWKWQHDEPQFRASYISHSLHLLDAIIVELRDGVREARRMVTPPTGVPVVGADTTVPPTHPGESTSAGSSASGESSVLRAERDTSADGDARLQGDETPTIEVGPSAAPSPSGRSNEQQ